MQMWRRGRTFFLVKAYPRISRDHQAVGQSLAGGGAVEPVPIVVSRGETCPCSIYKKILVSVPGHGQTVGQQCRGALRYAHPSMPVHPSRGLRRMVRASGCGRRRIRE